MSNKEKLEEHFGYLNSLEYDFLNQGFHALALHPEWLDNQKQAKLYIEELLVGLRSLSVPEQMKLVDSISMVIDSPSIIDQN